jgi:ubiquinone/menaquinone biosynthesis C-methylase UbiE
MPFPWTSSSIRFHPRCTASNGLLAPQLQGFLTDSSEGADVYEPLILQNDLLLKVEEPIADCSLIMPRWNIRRYDGASEETIYPLEYAFHLLGDLRGRTVVELGCKAGINTVILAALGARVLVVDESEENLSVAAQRAYVNGVQANVHFLRWDGGTIPANDGCADRVFCDWTLNVDPVQMGRRIRRVLRPGGTAVFIHSSRSLKSDEVRSISRAVGISGKHREFWLTTRLLSRKGYGTFSALAQWIQRIDAALLRHFPATRSFASCLVWEARKEC